MSLLEKILAQYEEQERQTILAAWRYTEQALEGMKRGNNQPFTEHPLGVAAILALETGLPADTVSALFLHEATRFRPQLLETIREEFPADMVDIAICLNKIAAIRPKDTRLEAENYRRLIVSYSKDPRVTLIKFADRLEVLRNLELLPKSSQQQKLLETIFLYIPLAHQLGLYHIKSEMEDLFFRHTEPEHWRTITNKLKATEAERERILVSFIEPLKERIKAKGISFTYKSRTKTAWSIWKKMQTQKVPFEGVYDVMAIRLIIDAPDDRNIERELCWEVYSLVTERFTPDNRRLRDWISKPKPNGYESLHNTVQVDNQGYVEVQIRTRRMDEMAENGPASHASYKGVQKTSSIEEWLKGVKHLLENGGDADYRQISNYVQDEVFVFTPTGELKRLPAGATVLDFAFAVHTNLGLKCSGAKIDGKVVSIKEQLQTGNVIEIMSNRNQKPSADWLNFVVTSKARNKIKLKINENDLKLAADGKELLNRRLKNWKLELEDEELTLLCKKYKQRTINDFFKSIAEETISLQELKAWIQERRSEPENAGSPVAETPEQEKAPRQNRSEREDYLVLGDRLSNVEYTMAKCCNPIFGDEVMGFVSIKGGIKIHRMSCPNLTRLLERYPYRIQPVRWKTDIQTTSFQCTVKVIMDEPSVMTALIEILNGYKIQLRSSNMEKRNRRGEEEYDLRLVISVENNQALDKVLSGFRRTKGVKQVVRG